MKKNLLIFLASFVLVFVLGLGLWLFLRSGAEAPAPLETPAASVTPAPMVTPASAPETPASSTAEAPLSGEAPAETEAPTDSEDDGPVFPETGYTTGDRELDLWLKEIIDSQWEEGLTQEELQQRLYLYVRDKFGYRKSKIYSEADGDFSASAIANMKQFLNGNCYNFACMQYGLFRAIGVDAHVCVGWIGADRPHCWVEVVQDGVAYICDAEMEMQSIHFRNEPRNFYMETYENLDYQMYIKLFRFPEEAVSDDSPGLTNAG